MLDEDALARLSLHCLRNRSQASGSLLGPFTLARLHRFVRSRTSSSLSSAAKTNHVDRRVARQDLRHTRGATIIGEC